MDSMMLYSIISIVSSIVIWTVWSKFVHEKKVEQNRSTPYTDFEKCEPPLGTIGGIGFHFFQSGRFDLATGSFAYYSFFCFIIPLFPLGCYRARLASNFGRNTSYTVYGYEKWRFWEVFEIYMYSIAGAAFIIGIITLIISFF